MVKKMCFVAVEILGLTSIVMAGTFDLTVFPEARDIAPGAGVEYLLDIAFCDGYSDTVSLTAEADPSIHVVFQDSTVTASGQAIMSAIVDTSQSNQTFPITISATDGAIIQTAFVTLTVTDQPYVYDEDFAIQIRDTTIQYLTQEHPHFAAEFGISQEWEWAGYVPYPPRLVVTHYVFLSGDWRMVVMWHVTIPPHDWKRVFLTNDQEGAYWAIEIDTDGEIKEIPCRRNVYYSDTTLGVGENTAAAGIPRMVLSQNYPNPFNPQTTISYQLPSKVGVSLKVYNVLGEEVKTLINEEQPSGSYRVEWDGTNDAGRAVASGIYFYRLRAGDEYSQTKRLLLVR